MSTPVISTAAAAAVASARLVLVLAFAGAAEAQAPGDDSARSRAVRQAGAPAPTSAANDSLFRRAERLVREGRGPAGRALVDTLLAGTRPGSARHGQALYWRATLAGDAAEAERGYRRVIVEYPATPWAGDALLNLAQLELARGDQEQALMHLHRFGREYAGHESRARASFWLARLHFDRKHEARGCAALATARASASPEDVELRNQIEYYSQRCLGVDTTAPATPRSVANPQRDPQRDTTRQPRRDTARTTLRDTTLRDTTLRDMTPRDTTPSVPSVPAPPAATPRDTVREAGVVAPDRGAATEDSAAGDRAVVGGGFTVQVAAYDTRPPAEELIDRLRARGYTARLASTARPFRVRVGRYDTRADAIAAQRRLKAKGIEGFVTETERP